MSTDTKGTISDQWLFLPTHLNQTPGITTDKKNLQNELKLRNLGVEFLFRVGLQLKLNVPVLAAASIFLHRFYMRHSIDAYVVYDIAAAALFLACKVEESSRKLKDVAGVCQSKATGLPMAAVPNEHDPGIQTWTRTILAYEELLLETLCFDLSTEHPHNILLSAANALEANEHLVAYSWSVLNDSFRTPLCVLYHSRVIACAAYVMALHTLSPGYPLSSLIEPIFAGPIFEKFGLTDMEGTQVGDVIALLLDFYHHIQSHVSEKFWRSNPFAASNYELIPHYSFGETTEESTSSEAPVNTASASEETLSTG
ncbi:cyclin-like protein [Clavulina sp. PMI_390]|nr:cyclin-like protein [Clavulina sp. PMI_390]